MKDLDKSFFCAYPNGNSKLKTRNSKPETQNPISVLKVGLTGGIGSGKSTVSRIFNVLGIPVFDADREAKKIMEEDQQLITALQQEFGNEIYTDGKLNRQVLAGVVFGNPYLLEKLNAIVHPVTIAAAFDWVDKQTTPYVVKEAALFFEAGSAAGIDIMVGVFAPKHVRINRVMDRDKVSRDQVLDRMKRQIDEEIKMKLCDFVLVNDEQQLLVPQVLQLHETLLASAGAR